MLQLKIIGVLKTNLMKIERTLKDEPNDFSIDEIKKNFIKIPIISRKV